MLAFVKDVITLFIWQFQQRQSPDEGLQEELLRRVVVVGRRPERRRQVPASQRHLDHPRTPTSAADPQLLLQFPGGCGSGLEGHGLQRADPDPGSG